MSTTLAIKPLWKRRWVKFLLACVIFAVGGLGWFHLSAQRLINQELARLRSQGYPTTLVELDAWYPTPQGPNAADLHLKAHAALVESEGFEDRLPLIGSYELPAHDQPLPAEIIDAIGQYLRLSKAPLGLLAEAAQILECRYVDDMTQGFDALLPHLSKLRPLARLLSLQAIYHAETGQTDLAASSVIHAMNLGASLKNEPVLISRLVQISIEALTIHTLERVLERTTMSDDQYSQLSAAFSRTIGPSGMERAFVGERCIGISLLLGLTPDDWLNESMRRGYGWYISHPYRALGLQRRDTLAYLTIMQDVILHAQDPSANPFDTDAIMHNLPRYCLYSRILLPALGSTMGTHTTHQATIKTAVVALAVKRYQLANHRPPEQLADLVPNYLDEIPTDPFGGRTLRYKHEANSVVIYSIGKDRTDNSGTSHNAAGATHVEGTDIVFRVGSS